jgi:formylglycine-generating enzyme required for sulfatase activity
MEMTKLFFGRSLSEQESIPRNQWCYDLDQGIQDGMKLPADYLSRTGYRLPTEAEWEYACRAGAATSRYFGETDVLLPEYAWFTRNSLNRGFTRVGNLKPNDLGLFDMLGNVVEWCQDAADRYRAGACCEPTEDTEAQPPVVDARQRVARGGGQNFDPWFVRSAMRIFMEPRNRSSYFGFRVARTCTQQDE